MNKESIARVSWDGLHKRAHNFGRQIRTSTYNSKESKQSAITTKTLLTNLLFYEI